MKSRPYVLIVQPCCPTYRRRFFELIAKELDISLVCSEVSIDGVHGDASDLACQVHIVKLAQFAGRRLVWQQAVVSRLLREPPAILVVNGNPRYLSSVAAIFVARIRGTKIVWWGHAMSSTSRPLRAWFRKQLMKLAHRVLLYYPEERRLIPASVRSRAVGIDNSVDSRSALIVSDSITGDEIRRFRAENGLGPDRLIVTIGRLSKKARIDLLLEAVSILRRVWENVRLVVIGGGEELEFLQRRASELGVNDGVQFTGPVFDEATVGLWMRSSAVFAYGGAVGLSLIHAFSYGLPAVIASPVSGHNPEALLFKEGQHGLFFSHGDARSLAEAIQKLLLNSEHAVSMGQNAQHLVRERLSVEKMADNFINALQNMGQ